MSIQLLRRRFTVDEYYRMAETGILSDNDRVELIDGEIVEMTPIGSRHAACVDRLTRLFTFLFGERVIVRVQNPIRLGLYSEPQPDLAILRPRPDFYAEAHPSPEDVLLVVEVADTSADPDRQIKIPLYARAGIPTVWLVDLSRGHVEVYTNPTPEGYQSMSRLRPGDSLSVEALPGIVLTADQILG